MRAAAIEDRWECRLRRVAARRMTAAGAPDRRRGAVAAGAAAPRVAGEAVAELERALTRHPLRERLWELLLTATAFATAGVSPRPVYDRAAADRSPTTSASSPTGGSADVAALVQRSAGSPSWFGERRDAPADLARPGAVAGCHPRAGCRCR